MKNIVFGPVISRRFGISLGVDLSPTLKQCNFDCLYCELEGKKAQGQMAEVLDIDVLIQSVLEALLKHPKIDVLTITANGEPTLYPYLYELISAIKPHIPKGVSTLILSNGSRFGEMSVQKALHLFDIVKFSLDGAISKSFLRVDRPHKNISLEALLEGIKSFGSVYSGKLVAEILLVKGVNDSLENINAIATFLRQINVARVDLGTIDRPPAYKASALSNSELHEIAKRFDGLYVSLPFRKNDPNITAKSYEMPELLDLIARRPMSVSEAPILLDTKTLQLAEKLVGEKKLFIKNVANLAFYTTKSE
ncbi:radical SAM protein [Helicobacter sp. 11S02596-1]|uniref:radical SAM protein n=1 Tax=Helicobacter sp. 11S02596-1 TaxID=1476194 RepID=UPI000BA5B797|nr:radical SAM protein [Helicobacter sp. 11S02596-1]PAF43966.1 hypothetical protein BJI48_04050 [Helicobacter sp. 11S02596-1]